MTEMPNIPLYTARTWAFLYNGKNLVMEPQVLRVAAYIEKWSYQIACHMLVRHKIELAHAKDRAYAHHPRHSLIL